MTQPKYRSRFLQRCHERGFMHQCTNDEALDAMLADYERRGEPCVAYIGFDCTAASLHVGSLMQIMILRHFQKCGHKPIILLGGGTTKIGDPSGKDKSRELLDTKQITQNREDISKNFTSFLSFGNHSTDAVIVDNAEWIDSLNIIDFLRNIGGRFSISRMMGMESVKQRLGAEGEGSLSLLEFCYMTFQAYDFIELEQRYGCRLQIGGSDQWGNITQGVDLYHRMNPTPSGELRSSYLFGLTTPLLTTASGAKMGKTADGAVWLNPDMLSAYNYWQYWRNCDDADVGRFLRYFTELPLDEIEALERSEGAAINEVKKRLATEATALLHGKQAALQAEQTAKEAFELGQTSENLPSIDVSLSEHGTTLPAFKLFQLAGLADSGAAARRLIKGGGAKLDDQKVADEMQSVNLSAYKAAPLKCSAGKKKHVLVRITE